jgi:hypothetical protein
MLKLKQTENIELDLKSHKLHTNEMHGKDNIKFDLKRFGLLC